MQLMWQKRLDEYLDAKREHGEATRLFWRALRTMDKLSKQMDDKRASTIAGVDLADERSVRAARKERRALANLQASLAGIPTAKRYMIRGRVLCADPLPKAANATIWGEP